MTEQQYIQANESMFGGQDETVIECRTVKLVTVRKAHLCMCPAHKEMHQVMPGQRAVADRAIADGSWGTSYVCLPCLESWWNHIERHADYCIVGRTRGGTKGGRS